MHPLQVTAEGLVQASDQHFHNAEVVLGAAHRTPLGGPDWLPSSDAVSLLNACVGMASHRCADRLRETAQQLSRSGQLYAKTDSQSGEAVDSVWL